MDVGPTFFTLLQLEMATNGVRTSHCDPPLSKHTDHGIVHFGVVHPPPPPSSSMGLNLIPPPFPTLFAKVSISYLIANVEGWVIIHALQHTLDVGVSSSFGYVVLYKLVLLLQSDLSATVPHKTVPII